MDEVYRGYRIAIKLVDGSWRARVTHVRGTALAIRIVATQHEGAGLCLERARAAVDRYVAFIEPGPSLDEV